MSQYTRHQPGRTPTYGGTEECSPHEHPAPQPHPPGEDCDDLPTTTPPELERKECPPDDRCCCPKGPTTTPNCLEELIAEQAQKATVAEEARKAEQDLTKILDKAKTALSEYPQTKYEELIKRWVTQDAQIAELVRKL